MAFKLAITHHCTYTQANKMATPMGYLHNCIHNPVIHNGQGIYQYINDKTHVIHNKLPFSLYKWKKSDSYPKEGSWGHYDGQRGNTGCYLYRDPRTGNIECHLHREPRTGNTGCHLHRVPRTGKFIETESMVAASASGNWPNGSQSAELN